MSNPTFVADELVTASKMNELPKGVLGYAQVTANQGSITTGSDLTGLSVTVTVAAGRRLKITGFAAFNASVANEGNTFQIRESTTVLNSVLTMLTNATIQETAVVYAVVAPTVGAHTYKLYDLRQFATGTHSLIASATSPAFILVEDIGVV